MKLVFRGPNSIKFSAKSLLGVSDTIPSKVEAASHWASFLFMNVCFVDWLYVLYIFVSVLFRAQSDGKLIYVE